MYGFVDAEDREAFRTLLSVSGVGPKLAMTCSRISARTSWRCSVARADRARLEAISGVGKKTAARLLLELKDKLPVVALGERRGGRWRLRRRPRACWDDAASQACDALTRLGFSRAQAEAAVAKVSDTTTMARPVEQLLRQALADARIRRMIMPKPKIQDDHARTLGANRRLRDDREYDVDACGLRASTSSSARASSKRTSRVRGGGASAAKGRSTTCCSAVRPAWARPRSRYILAEEMGVHLSMASGPAIEHKGPLAALLTKLERATCCSSTRSTACRPWSRRTSTPAIEDFRIDIVHRRRAVRRDAAAAAQALHAGRRDHAHGLLTAPLLSRFGNIVRLDYYPAERAGRDRAAQRAAARRARRADAAREIARRARGTPRIANRLLRRARDFAEVLGDGRDRPAHGARSARAARGRRRRPRRDGPPLLARDHRALQGRPGRHRHARRRAVASRATRSKTCTSRS